MTLFGVIVLVGVATSVIYKIISYSTPGAGLKRAVKPIPKSEITNTEGNKVVKIVGEVEPLSEPLIAPLTGERCVCYESIVEELRDEDSNQMWLTLAQDTHRQNFLVRQGSQSALVKVRYAEVHLTDLQNQTTMTDAPPLVREFLEKRGEFSTARRHRIRYREGALIIGKNVMVCGFAKRENDLQAENAGYREQGTRLVFEHQDEHNLYISNDPSLLS